MEHSQFTHPITALFATMTPMARLLECLSTPKAWKGSHRMPAMIYMTSWHARKGHLNWFPTAFLVLKLDSHYSTLGHYRLAAYHHNALWNLRLQIQQNWWILFNFVYHPMTSLTQYSTGYIPKRGHWCQDLTPIWWLWVSISCYNLRFEFLTLRNQWHPEKTFEPFHLTNAQLHHNVDCKE